MPTLTTSADPQPSIALVMGPPKKGKTISSLTASDLCPSRVSAVKGPFTKHTGALTDLSDLLWLQFDPGGTVGFADFGVSVPMFDLSEVGLADIVRESRDAAEEARKRVKAGITKTIILDTVSFYNQKLMEKAEQVDDLDGQKMWGKVLSDNREVWSVLRNAGCDLILLAHAKARTEMAQANTDAGRVVQTNTARATKAQALPEIIADVAGQSLKLFRGAATHMFWVGPGTEKWGGKMQQGWWFYPDKTDSDTGTRRPILGTEPVPADWRVVKQLLAGGGR